MSYHPASLNHLSPADMAPPFAAYSHGVVVKTGSDMVFCSGQLGIDRDANVPEDVAGQARLCFKNIQAILAAAGLDLRDVVRINAYVTDRAYMQDYMTVRDQFFSVP